ncbi:hypothetical protein UFOVP232_48 [uncultured Caudovirales phage]|uniref:DUF7936 domain-containing protein n=1 Tax=uncultured Caudovirales phage TaxID=2100421 RepID=A0A6J7WTS7_9CAUD|nr:hypothetical protein UFOVP232_48 [uncultured Caudovirales phage]
MPATFTIKVNAIRTATVAGREGVVKQVDWTMIGEEAGQKFELPQTTTLADPDGQPFIELANLTEPEVAAWVEATEPNLVGIKTHIQIVLDKEVAKATLAATPMPWAPAPEATVNPTPSA